MKSTRSRKELRHVQILAAFDDNPALRVNQLAEDLGVSTETIRRDLAELDHIGRLSRTYGGAVSANKRFEPALNERLRLHVHERQAIAQAAVARVQGAETMVLGGGATMLAFARGLRATRHRITVITPAYPVAVELATNPLIEVVLLPGIFESQEHLVCGPETIRALERYRAEVAIIGASGLDPSGVSEAMLAAGEIYAAMLAHADHGVVLADHSKFGKRALFLLQGWTPALSLFTDQPPAGALAAALREGGSECIVTPVA